MSPDLQTPRRGGMSLEHKLPLLITALLVVTMSAGVFYTYLRVKDAAIEVATERMELISRQLSDLVAAGLPTRLATLGAAAGDPAVAAVLRSPGEETRAAAAQVLQGLRTAQETDLPILVWDRGFRPVAHIGRSPKPGDEAGTSEMYSSAALPDSGGYGPLVARGDVVHFWVIAPVRAGADTLGYVAELRRVGGAQSAAGIRALIGGGADVYFANAAHGPWVGLEGDPAEPPAEWPFTGGARYRHGSGGEHFG